MNLVDDLSTKHIFSIEVVKVKLVPNSGYRRRGLGEKQLIWVQIG